MKNRILSNIKFFLQVYTIVFGLTIMVTIIFMYSFGIDALRREFLVNCTVFSFVALAPSIYYFITQDVEKSVKRNIIEGLIYILINEATLMPLGYKYHMWNNLKSGILMCVSIICVHLISYILSLGKDVLLTKEINERLKEINVENGED